MLVAIKRGAKRVTNTCNFNHCFTATEIEWVPKQALAVAAQQLYTHVCRPSAVRGAQKLLNRQSRFRVALLMASSAATSIAVLLYHHCYLMPYQDLTLPHRTFFSA